jgi:hypothetical protein
MARMNVIAETARLTEAPLWERARAMFARAVAAIGQPAAIAAVAALPSELRGRIVGWLLLIETIVRKLLLAEAAALPRPKENGPRLVEIPLRSVGVYALVNQTAASASLAPPARRKASDLARPETWRASFAFSLPRDARVPERQAPRIRALWGPTPPPSPPAPAARQRHRQKSAFLLARRLEALRRVLNEPARYVRWLANRLRDLQKRNRDLAHQAFVATSRGQFCDRSDPRLRLNAIGKALIARFAFDSS